MTILEGTFGSPIDPMVPGGGGSGVPSDSPPAGYVWVTDGQGGGSFQPAPDATLYAKLWNVVHETGSYVANPFDLVVCDGTAEQDITLPSPVSPGQSVTVVRGTNTGLLKLLPAAGQNIDGQSNLTSPASRVMTAYGSRITVTALSSTAWVTTAQNSWLSPAAGSGMTASGLEIEGDTYLDGRLLATNTTAPTVSAINAGLSQVTVAGNDGRGVITIVTTATPPAVGVNLFTINFIAGYPAPPVILLTAQDKLNQQKMQPFGITTALFSVAPVNGALAASTTYSLGYAAIG